jgi:hypothetical protein
MTSDTENPDMNQDRGGMGGPLLQALLVVLSTYGLTMLGILRDSEDVVKPHQLTGGTAAVLVVVFTLTHAIIPMFFYRMFLSPLHGKKGKLMPQGFRSLVIGFIYLHMGIWYLSPVVGLAIYSRSLAPAWMILHMVLAKRENRTWVFLQYGSTAFALLLFLFCVSITQFYPQGLLVVVFQTGLLTLANWKGKKLWDAKHGAP